MITTIDLSRFAQPFFEEAADHVADMERLLLSLDPAAPDPEDLNAIFRAAHSIKGGAGTFGMSDVAAFTHVLESVLDRVRNGTLPVTQELINVCLESGDVLGAQLDGHRRGVAVDAEAATQMENRLRSIAARGKVSMANVTPPSVGARSFRLRFSPEAPLDTGTAAALLAELATLGTVEPVSANGAPVWEAIMATARPDDIVDIFAWLGDVSRLEVLPAGAAGNAACESPASLPTPAADDPGYGFFDAPSDTAADLGYGFFDAPPDAAAAPAADPAYGFFEPPSGVPQSVVDAPPHSAGERPTIRAGGRRDGDRAADTSIRVGIEKVDQLINLVGELVITHAMLAQSVERIDPVLYADVHKGLAQLERNSRDLQEAAMSIRMLPMSVVFSRFPRVVRDLAGKLGKQVELRLQGETTELDKSLTEQITDPLTHLVRNSLDHGIEGPEERVAAGKPPTGTIMLGASHQGGQIVIEVADDGRGLDRSRLLTKAREKGLPVADDASDHDVWQLIFAPGFSTAETVTDVSGRGVGMDVVKGNIQAIGGRVELATSPGYGTRTTIHLPLTLAILDGMSIALGANMFIVPLTNIVESLQPKAENIRAISGRGQILRVRDEYLPLLPLHRVFHLEPTFPDPTRGVTVVVSSGTEKVALGVDELLGQHQVVIKSLETNYRKVDGISGATIMGDGRVALILDIPALIAIGRRGSAESTLDQPGGK